MSSIGSCCGNSAQALFEQQAEALQQQRLEEGRELRPGVNGPAQGQPSGLDPETGVRAVAEPGKGQFIDLYA